MVFGVCGCGCGCGCGGDGGAGPGHFCLNAKQCYHLRVELPSLSLIAVR